MNTKNIMCGIAALLSNVQVAWREQPSAKPSCDVHTQSGLPSTPELVNSIQDMLRPRGPDQQGQHTVHLGQCVLQLLVSLLQLRGCDLDTGVNVPLQHECVRLQRGSEPAAAATVGTPEQQEVEKQQQQQREKQQQQQQQGQQQAAPMCSVLCYNGEVFGGLDVPKGQNDGQRLLEALSQCESEPLESQEAHVQRVLNTLRGPWSIIYWQATTGTLWFGRDCLGRRSLLAHFPPSSTTHLPAHPDPASTLTVNSSSSSGSKATGATQSVCAVPSSPAFILTSVAPRCEPVGHAHAASNGCSGGGGAAAAAVATAEPSQQPAENGASCASSNSGRAGRSKGTGAEGEEEGGGEHTEFGPDVQKSGRPWQEVPPGIYSLRPCSGAAAAATAAADAQPPLWLLTRHAWQDPLLQCLSIYPRRIRVPDDYNTQESEERLQGAPSTALDTEDEAFLGHMECVIAALRHAVQVRCCCIERCGALKHTPDHRASLDPQSQLPVLLLFSGGVDSTLLAALAHQVLPPDVPIELSNVCFAKGTSPDRVAAREALEELAAMAPTREWRLIEVDSDLAEVDEHREHILGLLHPAGTIMDLNIGAALWLAVRARGTLRLPQRHTHAAQATRSAQASTSPDSHNHAAAHVTLSADASASPKCHPGQPYTSQARVVLLGHGADEQCAGYGRHRTRFRLGGVAGLAEELTLDMQRMWVRNLGRDDRLVADWGRESRHPFLDESFVEALLKTPLQAIADLRAPPGVGDKRILRTALLRMGLPKSAARVKRAIQFGSRIGKLSNVRDFGSNRAANMVAAGTVQLSSLHQ